MTGPFMGCPEQRMTQAIYQSFLGSFDKTVANTTISQKVFVSEIITLRASVVPELKR